MAARKRPGLLLRADLHMHTIFSSDSSITPEQLIRQAGERSLDVVGVTDHNTTKGGTVTKRLAKTMMPGLLVLVGQEIKTNSGEIIVFGVRQTLPKNRPLLETIKSAKGKGGFIVVPHPFDMMRRGIGRGNLLRIMDNIDAVEVLNSKTIFGRFNRKARQFCDKHGLPMVAGSDAHMRQYIGTCYTEIDSMKKESGIYEAIREGKTRCAGCAVGLRGAGIRARISKTVRKFRR